MSNPEDISRLQQRLRSYRRSLATLLQQQADHGGRAFAPLPIVNAIDDNRKEIADLKRVLRSWGQVVSDHPDDFTADNFPPDFAPGPAGPEPGTSAPLLARKGISPMVLVVVTLLFLAAGGGMLFLQQRNEKETEVVIGAPTETPETARTYVTSGNAYLDKKEYDRAIQDYDRAIQLDPAYAAAYYNRGVAYLDKKEYDRAIQDYDRAIQLDPAFAVAYYNRGNAYKQQGKREQAITDFEKFLELSNDSYWREQAQNHLNELKR
jgi:tetratricopeptide (TPR) repeat protein